MAQHKPLIVPRLAQTRKRTDREEEAFHKKRFILRTCCSAYMDGLPFGKC